MVKKRVFAKSKPANKPRPVTLTVALLAFSLFSLLMFYSVSFSAYWDYLQQPHIISNERTDAIVVLTGGSGRVATGLELLREGKADMLFISGVGKGLVVQDLLAFWNGLPDNISKDKIMLGYAAQTTYGNAVETAQWMKQRHFKSLRLVTSDYHMPRALHEFEKQMPGIKIIPHPVEPLSLDPTSSEGLYMLAREHAKHLCVVFFENILEKLGLR